MKALLLILILSIAKSYCYYQGLWNLKRGGMFTKNVNIFKESSSLKLSMSPQWLDTLINSPSVLLADAVVTEEDILAISGQKVDLPDPTFFIVGFVGIVIGIAVLQFSLGDLATQEGQARVKDFVRLKRETERKRGFFD
eukprot:gene2821-3005_t